MVIKKHNTVVQVFTFHCSNLEKKRKEAVRVHSSTC